VTTARTWAVQSSNPGTGKKFFTSPKRPARLWVPTSPLFKGYRGSYQRVKRPESDVNHSHQPSVAVKNEWSLHLCYPYIHSWHRHTHTSKQMPRW